MRSFVQPGMRGTSVLESIPLQSRLTGIETCTGPSPLSALVFSPCKCASSHSGGSPVTWSVVYGQKSQISEQVERRSEVRTSECLYMQLCVHDYIRNLSVVTTGEASLNLVCPSLRVSSCALRPWDNSRLERAAVHPTASTGYHSTLPYLIT
jgi:hypothetical protein